MTDTNAPALKGPVIDGTKQYTVKIKETVFVGPTILVKGSSPIILGSTLIAMIESNPASIETYAAV